ncbi:hypothetical protein BGZ58_005500 [Dissophora ornata]|nr:hypothetical protein BGZ58_005500 [Dissophora ornata]
MDAFKKKLENIRAEADAAQTRAETAERELAAVKAEAAAKDQEAISLNNRITNLESQLETAETGGNDANLRELELKAEDLERRVRTLEKEKETNETKLEEMTEKLNNSKSELDETLRVMEEIRFLAPVLKGQIMAEQQQQTQQEVRFPEGCNSLLERCVHIMHTIDPIEKADLTLLLGRQWRETIHTRDESISSNNNSDGGDDANDSPSGSSSGSKPSMEIGRAFPPDKPLRPDNLEFVRPGFGVKVGKAGSLSSRIAILHALANVEQWAIDTALDNMTRFGYYTQATAGTALKNQIENEQNREFVMPNRFFDDFMQMACDESKHFKWLNERLESQGAHYGDLPVHASIWDSCTDTARSALARMAVVHMTIESRGLDVNPATIARFDRSGDVDSAKMLQKVHEDEVTHVQIGHRWFCYLLKKHEGVGVTEDDSDNDNKAFGAGNKKKSVDHDEDDDADNNLYEFRQVTPAYAQKEDGSLGEEIVDPVEAQRRKRFQEVVVQYFKGSLKPPFNTADREKGGLTRGWYEPLVVVRERTGFKPGAGRRLQSKKEKAVEGGDELAPADAPSDQAVQPTATGRSEKDTSVVVEPVSVVV